MPKHDEDAISPERVNELQFMAKGFYGTIIGLTDSPYEAMTIITMLHLMMWLNHRQPDGDTKTMLEDYNKNFMDNFEANQKAYQKGLN